MRETTPVSDSPDESAKSKYRKVNRGFATPRLDPSTHPGGVVGTTSSTCQFRNELVVNRSHAFWLVRRDSHDRTFEAPMRGIPIRFNQPLRQPPSNRERKEIFGGSHIWA